MQSMKETASNIAASAKSGMDKTKATLEEKVDKMKTKDPVEKQMATVIKHEKINEAELQKRETREHNAAVKEAAQAGHNTGTQALPAHGTAQPTTHVMPGQNIR